MPSNPRPRRLPSANPALKAAAATVGLVGLVTACGGTDKANGTGVAARATTTAAPATTAPATTTASRAPAAPAGAQQLQQATANGAAYWRYSINGTTAAQVVSGYRSELQAAGYSITDQGGGGGGWGKWGGAGAGLTGSHGGTYVSVQAGGQTGQATYFEVCVGPSSSSVQDCEDVSQGPGQQQQNQGQDQQQGQNDSNSGAS